MYTPGELGTAYTLYDIEEAKASHETYGGEAVVLQTLCFRTLIHLGLCVASRSL